MSRRDEFVVIETVLAVPGSQLYFFLPSLPFDFSVLFLSSHLKMPDMPALFQQSSSPPKLDFASAHSQLFQVPSSASASSSLYSLSVSRKRPRRDTEKLSTKFEASSEVASASPLIHSDYRQTSGADDFHSPAELDYRPNRYRESFGPPPLDGSVNSIVADTLGTSRKRSRRESSIASPTADGTSPSLAHQRVGWGRTVINAVGKVFDLCWSGAFKGFYAGGGQGYNMNGGSPATCSPSWQAGPASAEKDQVLHTPVPGQYPEEDVDRSWVVVPSEPADPFFGGDGAASPSLRARRIHQASSPRRRPAVMPRLGKKAALLTTPVKNPGLSSPRSKDGPGSAEMKRRAAQIRREEREEDASIQRLNKQLQAMIREGKEALGTTVEVGDLEMDYEYD